MARAATLRSRNMSRIRSRNTKPEKIVRRMLRQIADGVRQNVRTLPGTPDFVIRDRRTVVFVHGCFWHRHRCKQGRPIPGTRTEFWLQKFRSNVARDQRVRRKLRKLGWRVLTVWQCQIERKPDEVLSRLKERLRTVDG